MKRTLSIVAVLMCLASVAMRGQTRAPQAPKFQVDPMWPKPLPNHWILGSVTGLAVDSKDHIWIAHQGASSLTTNTEMGTGTNPQTAENCCIAAPPILEFDAAGALVSNFGGPSATNDYQWPRCIQGLGVDAKGNVWVAGNAGPVGQRGARQCTGGIAGLTTDPDAAPAAPRGGAAPAAGGRGGAGGRGAGAPAAPAALADAHILKFGPGGKFLKQIGMPGKSEGPESTTTLNRPTHIEVDAAANEVYVADAGNRRVVVFDSETGAYKRHFGAYGSKPDATVDLGKYDAAAPAKQFRSLSCVRLAKDGMVYVCDRTENRIQVFQKDGKFVKELFVSKTTQGGVDGGSAWDVAFSRDNAQQFMYVANGWDKKVVIMQRSTGTVLGTFGQGGRLPGEFVGVGSVALDSKGNLYTGETFEGKRVQKWLNR